MRSTSSLPTRPPIVPSDGIAFRLSASLVLARRMGRVSAAPRALPVIFETTQMGLQLAERSLSLDALIHQG